VTHAVIAKDLGSVREVVSRGLKKLENEGKLQLKRGKIVMK
jgi:CRP/FNR family transcriptional regulator